MTDLSPAAQAVMTAIIEISPAPADEIAAATLRAAADEVVPVPEHLLEFGIRKQLLAIADELEGAQ